MLEALVLTLLKTVVATCVKLYITSMAEGNKIRYNKAELGYAVPAWYMNPGAPGSTFYAYGTSTVGDEFESLEDAQQQAIVQMATLIRRCNREAIAKSVRYDKDSVKQRALIELFLKAEGLEEFIRMKAATDRKEFVKVKNPADIRAFVRLALPAADYEEWQGKTLQALKVKVTQQKTEDLIDELDKEIKDYGAPPPAEGGNDQPNPPEVGGDEPGSGDAPADDADKPAPKARAGKTDPSARIKAPAEGGDADDLENMDAKPAGKSKGGGGFTDLNRELDDAGGK